MDAIKAETAGRPGTIDLDVAAASVHVAVYRLGDLVANCIKEVESGPRGPSFAGAPHDVQVQERVPVVCVIGNSRDYTPMTGDF